MWKTCLALAELLRRSSAKAGQEFEKPRNIHIIILRTERNHFSGLKNLPVKNTNEEN